MDYPRPITKCLYLLLRRYAIFAVTRLDERLHPASCSEFRVPCTASNESDTRRHLFRRNLRSLMDNLDPYCYRGGSCRQSTIA